MAYRLGFLDDISCCGVIRELQGRRSVNWYVREELFQKGIVVAISLVLFFQEAIHECYVVRCDLMHIVGLTSTSLGASKSNLPV